MVATRFISEGEVIIKENPLIDGPPQMTPPICLGCYNLIDELNKRDCSKCGWPVCSETCEKLDTHRPECEITAQRKNGKVLFSQNFFSSLARLIDVFLFKNVNKLRFRSR